MRSNPAVKMLVVLCLVLSIGGCSHGFKNSTSNGLVTSISVGPGSMTLSVGSSQQFSATGRNGNGAAVEGSTYTWTSSNTSVATVSTSGLVTAVGSGTANITASLGSIVSPPAIITVPAPPVATISLNPPSATVTAGATQQFTATAQDAKGNTISGLTFTWASDKPSVATVSSSGLVTAVATGTANITATYGSVTSTAAVVTVPPPPVATVTIGPAAPTINVAATQQFTATAKDAGGNIIAGAAFTWTSSDPTVATISASGLATGVKAGATNITATSGGITSAVDVLTVVQPATVNGTAATGAPIAAQVVTLKDSAGNSATATTDSNGNFSINAVGMTPPYLLEVTPAGASAPIYSVSVGSALSQTVNINSLTDLIVRAYYSTVLDQTPDTAFANPAANPAPNPTQAGVVSQFVLNQVALWLNKNGVATDTASKFNLISTPFAANGSGYDKVLDETLVNLTNTYQPVMSITDGTTSQSTKFNFNSATYTLSAATTTTNANGTTSTTTSTLVPNAAGQSTALQAIQAQLAALSQVINTKGTALADTDIEPFMTSNVQFDGLTPEEAAAFFATITRGNPTTVTLTSLTSLDTSAGTATGIMQIEVNGSELSEPMNFALKNGTWLWDGDGHIGNVSIDTIAMNEYSGNPVTSSTQYEISADVEVPQGQVTGATVNGAGFNNLALTKEATRVETLNPTAATSETVTLDHWFGNVTLTSSSILTVGGQTVTATLTPATGTPVAYQSLTNSSTNDVPTMVGITSTSLSSLTLGGSNTFNWKLPTTFAVQSITAHADNYNGNSNSSTTTDCRVGDIVLAPTATSTTLTLPSTCSGPITEVHFVINVRGINGEEVEANVSYQ